MEYKFTFEDGSEAIMHYGVKGMKWRKHKKLQDREDFDARDYGMVDNSKESRMAVYNEAGINPRMTQSQAQRHLRKKYAKQKKERGTPKNFDSVRRMIQSRSMDSRLVKSLRS